MADEEVKGRGRPEGVWQRDPEEYKTRFHKFYYKNRGALLSAQRDKYAVRKAKKQCVVCGADTLDFKSKSKLFCRKHVRPGKKG